MGEWVNEAVQSHIGPKKDLGAFSALSLGHGLCQHHFITTVWTVWIGGLEAEGM